MNLQSRPPLARPRMAPPCRRPMFHRIFRADPMTVRDALVFLRQRFDGSADAEVIGRMELALAEVLNNICKHGREDDAGAPDGARAHPPLIHLWVVRHVGGIACAVTDDGRPLPPECLDPRQLPCLSVPAHTASPDMDDPDMDDPLMMLPEGGFGWYLIQDLASSLSYFREGRRNFLAFIVPLDPDPELPDPGVPQPTDA